MNREQMIERIKLDTAKKIKVVSAMPDGLSLDFVNGTCVFIEELDTFEEYLTESAKCPVDSEVKAYYMSGDRLAICHSITDSVSVSFFVNDYEDALEKLTGGACHVVTTSEPRTQQAVACIQEKQDA